MQDTTLFYDCHHNADYRLEILRNSFIEWQKECKYSRFKNTTPFETLIAILISFMIYYGKFKIKK